MALNRGNVTRTVVSEEPISGVLLDEGDISSVRSPMDDVPNPRMHQIAAAAPAPSVVNSFTSAGAIKDELKQAGFDDLDLSFRSFPTIVLKDGNFSISGEPMDSEFDVQIMGTISKWLYKASDLSKPPRDRNDKMVYSSDQITASDGSLIEDLLRDWRAAGLTVEIKKYKDVTAVLHQGGQQHMVILSVSPTSVARLDGYIYQVRAMYGVLPNQVLTRVSAGPKVGSGMSAFNPWEFSFVRKL